MKRSFRHSHAHQAATSSTHHSGGFGFSSITKAMMVTSAAR